MSLRRAYRKAVLGSACGLLLVAGLAPAANFTTLYSFAGGSDGLSPQSLPAIGANGVIYGTTVAGGGSSACNYGCGTVFSLTPPASPGAPWTESVLWAFGGVGDGTAPTGALIVGGGVLYGVATYGGNPSCMDGCGVIFSLAPPASPGGAWSEQILYSFTGGTDGANPVAGLTVGAGGGVLRDDLPRRRF